MAVRRVWRLSNARKPLPPRRERSKAAVAEQGLLVAETDWALVIARLLLGLGFRARTLVGAPNRSTRVRTASAACLRDGIGRQATEGEST
jgi:hypothetical protein